MSDQIIIKETGLKKDGCHIKTFEKTVTIQAGTGITIKNKYDGNYVISADNGSSNIIVKTSYSGTSVNILPNGQMILQTFSLKKNTINLIKVIITAVLSNGSTTWFEYVISYSYLTTQVIQSGDYYSITNGNFDINLKFQIISNDSLQIIILGNPLSMKLNYEVNVYQSNL